MQESFREKDHLLSLKVMRLTKPSIKPLIPITCEDNNSLGAVLNHVTETDVSACKGAEHLAAGELLSLPQGITYLFNHGADHRIFFT